MVSVSVGADAFQPLEEIRDRVDYRGTDFFDDNAELRFDELLVRLERESRGVFVTLYGDETPLEETGRVDTMRATYDAAMLLVHPVQDVTKVEIRNSPGSDWRELDANRWDFTYHRLILSNRTRVGPNRRGNALADNATRATWRDIASNVRVTYDRGYGAEAPNDIKSVQVQLINQMLRKLRREQTTAAASPDELAGMSNMNEVVTEEIRERIHDVTKPGGATMSV